MQKTKRLLARIAFGSLGVLLFVAVLRPAPVSIWATEAKTTPGQPAVSSAPSVAAWTPIIEDAYDGTYETTYPIPRVIAASGLPYQWGRVTRPVNPFRNTLWCVQGWSGASLVAGTDDYVDGVNTTVTYGPLDLRDAKSLQLSFRHWISVAEGDGLSWAVSVASAPTNFVPVTPAVQGAWESTSLDSASTPALAALLGQNAVYLSFRFRSDDDGQVDKGVFLDDVKLWGEVYSRLHVPLAFKTELDLGFSDDFSDITSGWPVQWKRKVSGWNIYGGYMLARPPEQVWADLMASRSEADKDPLTGDLWATDPTGLALEDARTRFLADEKEVYYSVLHDQFDHVFVAGPYRIDGDFDVEVRARYNYAQKWFDGNRYGLLLSREPINPEDPHSLHGYSFQVEINPNAGGTSFDTPWWRFKEWYRTNWKGDDCTQTPCDEDRTSADDPSGAIKSELGRWNKLRMERRGKDFKLYINGTHVRTVTPKADDLVGPGPYYVGLIARHTGSGTTELSYDILVEWDDLVVTPR